MCIWPGICYLFKTVCYAPFGYIENAVVLLIYLPKTGLPITSQFVTSFLCGYTVHIAHVHTLIGNMGCPLWTLWRIGWRASRRFRNLSQTVLMVTYWNLVTRPKCIIYSHSSAQLTNAHLAYRPWIVHNLTKLVMSEVKQFLSDPYETWAHYLKAYYRVQYR